jgi:hypothetical protein
MRKQKLSPEASKAKAVRDKKIAMTPHRKKRKRDNERMGQRSDSDIHHPSGGGPAVRVSIKNNRGNFGKGTKIEGPNMMGQTWLNRKINGPSAHGGKGGPVDPPKKKDGVKPYIAKNEIDYEQQNQLYSDSLDVHNQYESQFQPAYEVTSSTWNSKKAKEEYQKLDAKIDANNNYIYEPMKEADRVQDAVRAKYRGQLDNLKGSRSVPGGPYQQLEDKMTEEVSKAGRPFYDILNQRDDEVRKDNEDMLARTGYLADEHQTILTTNQTKYQFDKPDPNFTVKGMKPEKWEPTTEEGTEYFRGFYEPAKNKYGAIDGKLIEGTGRLRKDPDRTYYSPKFKAPTREVRRPPATVMGTSGKWEIATDYQKRKKLSDAQMNKAFPLLKLSTSKK